MLYGWEGATWNHTADILAMIANTNRTADMEPFYRSNFHPHQQDNEPPPDIVVNDITALKGMFV